jgi:Zn-dependent protease with chaperone function
MTLLSLSVSGTLLISSILAGCFPWQLHFQNNQDFEGPEKNDLLSKIKKLAKKLEIKKEISLLEEKDLGTVKAVGVAILPGRAAIFIDPDIARNLSLPELEFIMAHELAHIKANDVILKLTYLSAVYLIAAVAMNTLPWSTGAGLAIGEATVSAAVFVAYHFFSQWREGCADSLGFSVCSEKAKRAAFKFFEEERTSLLSKRNSKEGSYLSRLWRSFQITEDGDNRLDVGHPPTTARIRALSQQQKNESFSQFGDVL